MYDGRMLRLFRLFGVPVSVHWSFALLLIWIGVSLGPVVMAFVVLSVLAHEFGHVLVARRYGYTTREVVAMGFGMVAQIEDDIDDGEAAIALAGPLVNFAIAALILGALNAVLAMGYTIEAFGLGEGVADLAITVAHANLVLGVFNMFPLFPLDGGRVVRAVVSKFKPRLWATKAAAWLGTACAAVLLPLAVVEGHVLTCALIVMVVVWSWGEVRRLERGAQVNMY